MRSATDFLCLIFNLKNRYDAIYFNINNWETPLVRLKICKIYYENYLNAINKQFSEINNFEVVQIIIMYYSRDIITKHCYLCWLKNFS